MFINYVFFKFDLWGLKMLPSFKTKGSQVFINKPHGSSCRSVNQYFLRGNVNVKQPVNVNQSKD